MSQRRGLWTFSFFSPSSMASGRHFGTFGWCLRTRVPIQSSTATLSPIFVQIRYRVLGVVASKLKLNKDVQCRRMRSPSCRAFSQTLVLQERWLLGVRNLGFENERRGSVWAVLLRAIQLGASCGKLAAGEREDKASDEFEVVEKTRLGQESKKRAEKTANLGSGSAAMEMLAKASFALPLQHWTWLCTGASVVHGSALG